MELFNINLLPYGGTVNYYGQIFDKQTADDHFDNLFNRIVWKNDEAIIMGRHIITKRKVAWYGDKNYCYTYSNIKKTALVWNEQLLFIKKIVENRLQISFNSCLLNLYSNGDEGMAWHSDSEKELGKNTTIASLSFGAERIFNFKHKKTQEKVSIVLQNASLLAMKNDTQTNWLHSLPKSKKIITPRINLTFRNII